MSHFKLSIRYSLKKWYDKSISRSSSYSTAITSLRWLVFALYLPGAVAMDYGAYSSSCQANGGTAALGPGGVYQCNFAQPAPPVGGVGGMQQQLLQQGAGIVGQAIGNAILQSILGNPQQNAANQAAAQAAAQKAAQDAAQADEQRRQADEAAMRQQEQIKQRILGAIKEGTTETPALGLMTGDEADAPLQVTRVANDFGTTALVPVNTAPGSSAGKRLELMLGDDADAPPISMQAGQGFDTAGKMQGSVSSPPPTPSSKPVAQNVKLLKDLKAKLKKNDADVRSLNDQLTQLQQAPTTDPVAINQVQQKIAVKENEKKKIMLDLTAADPDAPGTGSFPGNTGTSPASTVTMGTSQ